MARVGATLKHSTPPFASFFTPEACFLPGLLSWASSSGPREGLLCGAGEA